jgi:hypothetical protein
MSKRTLAPSFHRIGRLPNRRIEHAVETCRVLVPVVEPGSLVRAARSRDGKAILELGGSQIAYYSDQREGTTVEAVLGKLGDAARRRAENRAKPAQAIEGDGMEAVRTKAETFAGGHVVVEDCLAMRCGPPRLRIDAGSRRIVRILPDGGRRDRETDAKDLALEGPWMSLALSERDLAVAVAEAVAIEIAGVEGREPGPVEDRSGFEVLDPDAVGRWAAADAPWIRVSIAADLVRLLRPVVGHLDRDAAGLYLRLRDAVHAAPGGVAVPRLVDGLAGAILGHGLPDGCEAREWSGIRIAATAIRARSKPAGSMRAPATA